MRQKLDTCAWGSALLLCSLELGDVWLYHLLSGIGLPGVDSKAVFEAFERFCLGSKKLNSGDIESHAFYRLLLSNDVLCRIFRFLLSIPLQSVS